jgi:S1/P1 Nuclease
MKYVAVIFGISLSCITLAVPENALAWGKSGHLAVCDFAYRTVSKNVRDQINILLKADGEHTSFNRGCLEEDEVPRPHPDDHFINYKRSQADVTDALCPENASCILSGIERDVAVLADRSRPAKERARALMAIGHWVGDIHQPLHISFADDRGGNKLLVSGVCGSAKDSNLHSVWDKCLVEKQVMGARLKATWAGTTVTYRAVDRFVRKTTATEKTEWTATLPWQWAQESYRIARSENVKYCTLNEAATVCSKPTIDRIPISATYLTQNGTIVETRLRKAGVRLAFVLEQALRQQ